MKKIKGRVLPPGGKIGVFAPASPVSCREVIEKYTKTLKSCGYQLVLGETTRPADGYLAGTDWERRADLERFWEDDSIQAVWCLRGGYGSIRILPALYLGLIEKNPKILIGFSDITGLELGLWTQTRLVTFHGPVLTTLQSDFSLNHALRMLSGEILKKTFEWPSDSISGYKILRPGRACGILVGGNLSIITSLLGTKYFPNLEGALLFLEDTKEAAYRIDRMLTQLLLGGALELVNGVMVGRCNPVEGENEMDLVNVFEERLTNLSCPVSYGFPIGHIHDQWTLPQGILAEVDMENGKLSLLESPLLY